MDRLLTAPEVADILGVHPNWVFAAAKRGQLPSVKVGRARRFSRTALEAWLEQLAKKAT